MIRCYQNEKSCLKLRWKSPFLTWNLLPCLYIAISLYVICVAAASLGFACMIPARQGVLGVVLHSASIRSWHGCCREYFLLEVLRMLTFQFIIECIQLSTGFYGRLTSLLSYIEDSISTGPLIQSLAFSGVTSRYWWISKLDNIWAPSIPPFFKVSAFPEPAGKLLHGFKTINCHPSLVRQTQS
jgi:hypothetical protein